MHTYRIGRRGFMAGTAALVGGLGAGALSAPALAQARTPIRISLNAPRDGSNAAFFLAAAKGYFAAEGLEPTLDPSRGAGDALQRVGSDTYDFGFADFTVAVQFHAANPTAAPLGVMGIYTRSPIAIISLTKANVKTPKDLEGKKLGAPPTDAGYLLLPAFAQMTGLDVSKIQVEAIDLTLRESTLATGRVDAVTGFDSTTWFNLKRIGMKREDIQFMYFSDHGLDFYSNGMHVSRKFQRENEGKIAGAVRAMLKGWKDTIANPAETIDALIKVDPLVERANEIERLEWVLANQVVNDHTKQYGLGTIDPGRLGRSIEQVAGAMKLPRVPTVAEVWTDKYLPPMADRKI